MLTQEELTAKINRVRQAVRRMPNLELHFEPPKESYFQALLSRGDRRVARLLFETEQRGRDWKWLLAQGSARLAPEIPPIDFYATRRFSFEELLPWEIVDSRIDRRLLLREALRAHHGEDFRLSDDPASGRISDGSEFERPEQAPTETLFETSVVNPSSVGATG
jgi:hypothetical protein